MRASVSLILESMQGSHTLKTSSHTEIFSVQTKSSRLFRRRKVVLSFRCDYYLLSAFELRGWMKVVVALLKADSAL